MTDANEGARGDLEFGTIPRLVGSAAARHEGRVAIEDGATVLTYRALDAIVTEVASAWCVRRISI